MPTGRHRSAQHKAVRPPRRLSPLSLTSPTLRAAAVTAPALTVGVVGVGMANAGGVTAELAGAHVRRVVATPSSAETANDAFRTQSVSRSADRVVIAAREGRQARQRLVRFTTNDLDLRATPSPDARVAEEISSGTKVIATGLTRGPYAEVTWKGQRHWVTAQYLSETRPTDPADLPLSDAACPRDSSVEHGLKASTIRVYRAVCAAFPEITTYGGLGPREEHDTGNAIDIMTTDVELGTKIAAFVQAHAAELDIYDIIWRQHIWTPVRAGEGWRLMPNRGSETANHMNHVHVGTNP